MRTKYFIRYIKINLLIAITLVFTLSSAQGEEKQKIGIMKFEVSQNLDPSLGTFLYSQLMARMVECDKHIVVDWEEINRVLKYISESLPNISQEKAKQQAIEQLGIDKMYLGSLNQVGSRYYLSVKVLNLDISIDRTVSDSIDNLDNIGESVNYIAQQLIVTPEEAKQLRQERLAWRIVQKDRNEDSLKSFLDKHPNGFYAKEARTEYEQLRSARRARETNIKEEQEKNRRKQEELMNNIAGKWRIKVTPTTRSGTNIYIINDKSILEIFQSDTRVSVNFSVIPATIYEGPKDIALRGTYRNGVLMLDSKGYQIRGQINDIGNITGTIIYKSNSNDFTMTRLNPDDIPTKYKNIMLQPLHRPRRTGMCFIATAAYGSPWEKNVVTLRDFRDRWLLTNGPGRCFVETYYRLSPPLADAIAERAWARCATRIILTPLVIFAGAVMGKPDDICIVIILIYLSVLFINAWRKRRLSRINPQLSENIEVNNQ